MAGQGREAGRAERLVDAPVGRGRAIGRDAVDRQHAARMQVGPQRREPVERQQGAVVGRARERQVGDDDVEGAGSVGRASRASATVTVTRGSSRLPPLNGASSARARSTTRGSMSTTRIERTSGVPQQFAGEQAVAAAEDQQVDRPAEPGGRGGDRRMGQPLVVDRLVGRCRTGGRRPGRGGAGRAAVPGRARGFMVHGVWPGSDGASRWLADQEEEADDDHADADDDPTGEAIRRSLSRSGRRCRPSRPRPAETGQDLDGVERDHPALIDGHLALGPALDGEIPAGAVVVPGHAAAGAGRARCRWRRSAGQAVSSGLVDHLGRGVRPRRSPG